MLETFLLICLLLLLTILFRPRRKPRAPYVRHTTSTRNGRPWWKDNEPY